LLTARVAYDQLTADAPEVLQMVEQKLSVIAMFVNSEKDYPFVEAATFADFIKNSGFQDITNWHYIDTPFFDENYTTEVDPEYYNVSWAINQMRQSIVDPVGAIYGPAPEVNPVNAEFS
jgi:hypothetical protein